MKLLVFGNKGQLGSFLEQYLGELGDIQAFDQPDVELRNIPQIQEIIETQRPDVIVNAAAYTAVDQAETDRDTAEQVNAQAPGAMAEAAKRINALFIHYSTDYVFSGNSDHPYTEDMETGPCNVYGQTKLEGERAIAAAGGDYLILRTSWLYSHRGKNFLNTILKLTEERDELRVIDDQYGAPTYAGALAQATAKLVRQTIGKIKPNQVGIYHTTCGGVTSWHKFAAAILECTGKDSVRILPIPTSAYPTPASRPMYSVLDNGKFYRHFKIALPEWRDGLDECLADAGIGN